MRTKAVTKHAQNLDKFWVSSAAFYVQVSKNRCCNREALFQASSTCQVFVIWFCFVYYYYDYHYYLPLQVRCWFFGCFDYYYYSYYYYYRREVLFHASPTGQVLTSLLSLLSSSALLYTYCCYYYCYYNITVMYIFLL